MSNNGNQYGNSQAGDNYYLGLGSDGKARIGLQVNGATNIAWDTLLSKSDLRRGVVMITRKPGAITSVTVNFSEPLPSAPLIFLCGNTDGPDEGMLSVSNVSATSFKVNVKSLTSTSNIAVNWLAIV